MERDDDKASQLLLFDSIELCEAVPATCVADVQTMPILEDYERILVAFSGGKDSVALLLNLIDCGVPREKIQLHHHLVDGEDDDGLFDWPVTKAYCSAVARAFGIPITFSWRVGGLEREMLRNEEPTAPTAIPHGGGYRLVGGSGPAGTRRKFPQQSADLSVRWCSSYGKISLMDSWITNDEQFRHGKTLVLTGERAQESSARAKYKVFEPHRSDNRAGARVKRWVDVWRAVHGWSEEQVWAIIARHRVQAHPAYHLGYGRLSCRSCVFANKHQLATNRLIAPVQFARIATRESEFGVTIHRKYTVTELADLGTPYDVQQRWIEVANAHTFNMPVFVDEWTMPLGAFGDSSGPT